MAFPQRRRTPSFSSSLLDAIYRSIDESDGLEPTIYHLDDDNNNIKTVRSQNKIDIVCNNDKLKSLRRAVMDDENWVYGRSSSYGGTTVCHSSSNSSDSSSSAATFSSSEAESCGGPRRSRKPEKLAAQGKRSESEKKKREEALDERFSKTDQKVKAVRIFEELKRSKQPISPGSRLTNFLNSIFQSNAKKVKLCSVGATRDVKCSSKSCFSRSRHNTEDKNKNENSNNGTKRSVRFYPVNIIVDENCRASGSKNIHEKNPTLVPEFTPTNKVGRRSSLKEELKINHHREMTCIASKIGLKHFVGNYKDNDEGEAEEEDDVWSYSSSDLFELDHRIGIAARYKEELPVYETTDFKTNQAIARGLIL